MIRMILEVNHHRGEEDLFCPQVFCDLCGERIEASGNVLYMSGRKGPLTGEMFHTHKRCNRTFENRNPPPEGARWYFLELCHLPIQLAANLGYGDTRKEIARKIVEDR